MYRKSKKVVEAEKWVDGYINKNKSAPTYTEVAVGLKISRTAAYGRCNKFRDKMIQNSDLKKAGERTTRVKLEYLIPVSKFESFAALLKKINELLENETATH